LLLNKFQNNTQIEPKFEFYVAKNVKAEGVRLDLKKRREEPGNNGEKKRKNYGGYFSIRVFVSM
jgi:hypothetical protein